MNLAILSLAAARDKHKLASTAAWILLVDLNFQGQHIRVVRNTDAMTFDAGDGLGPQSYQPLAFELVGAETKNDGSLPQFSIKVSNINRLVEGAIVQFSGAAGATCNIYVVNTDNPSGEPELALETVIIRTSTTSKWVTFTCGAASPLRMLFPKMLYYQNTCMWRYKSIQCAYTGTLPTCSLTYDGPNGCIAHANGVRFGGFPGCGSNGATIASQI
jgi:phage-related protein